MKTVNCPLVPSSIMELNDFKALVANNRTLYILILLISWLYLGLTNCSWDQKSKKILFRLLISRSYLWQTNCSWDLKSKKHYFWLLISWKMLWSGGWINVTTFNLINFVALMIKKIFGSPVLISWNLISWPTVSRTHFITCHTGSFLVGRWVRCVKKHQLIHIGTLPSNLNVKWNKTVMKLKITLPDHVIRQL